MDHLLDIKSPIASELELFKRLFISSLSSSNVLLNEVLDHLKQREGKMMRPVLALLTAALFGKITERTLHAAVALELLHTASLIHDDVVDESEERRGQLSVNAIFNNKVAVLGGDYLLATCLVEAGRTESGLIINTISGLGQDLSDGELLQLSNIKTDYFSEDVYFNVIRKKTAALFSACTKAGALSVEATTEQVEWARLFGEYLGVAFQIRDDIFDYYDNKSIGKPTGNDMIEGKLTLPAIYVLNALNDKWARGVALKVRYGEASLKEIKKLVEYVKENGGIDYATNVMYEYQSKALQLLDGMPDSDIKSSLIAFSKHVVDRKK
ncbi:polyprenyl synthetase family protein [Bacteroides sp. 519]|uniref:polyprenyl synthetase family protein n=1 Tax=Bacteroides sp. 519 TaxID=2302937 RepID=UPI0013D53CF9|nr:polyprenyl synthetase family protein [Bacteroides sp. 519]NDV57733.1 polyprenyl synthetase family protein [Bacteroides sp. 519]